MTARHTLARLELDAEELSARQEITARELGAYIRSQRIERRMNQCTLADKAQVHQSTLSLIESGNKLPTLAMFDKIMKAINSFEP